MGSTAVHMELFSMSDRRCRVRVIRLKTRGTEGNSDRSQEKEEKQRKKNKGKKTKKHDTCVKRQKQTTTQTGASDKMTFEPSSAFMIRMHQEQQWLSIGHTSCDTRKRHLCHLTAVLTHSTLTEAQNFVLITKTKTTREA